MVSRDPSGQPAQSQTLGLPLRATPSLWIVTLALAAYYAASMSRDLGLYDSGELALAAVQLGLGHPPGQPLHTLLGFLCSRATPGARLIGVNLMSALPTALTLLPALSIAQTLCRYRLQGAALAWLPICVAVIGLHPALWEPATRTEVYALATLLAVWAIASALPVMLGRPTLASAAALSFRAGLALGLCASTNPAIAFLAGLALTPGALQAAVRRQMPPRCLLLSAAGAFVGLLPYLYLPLTAARSGVLVWGGLHNAADYVRYLSLRDYAHNQTIDLVTWLEHLWKWWRWSARQLLLPLIVLGLGGHLRAHTGAPLARALAPVLLGGLLSLIAFNVVWNLDVPDYNGYVASAYWVLAAGAAALAADAFAVGRRGASAAVAVCLLALLWAPPRLTSRTRHRDHVARALAEQVLAQAPRDAIVIALADHFAGSFFYLQGAEHARPDVAVLAYGLSSSSWHWDMLWAQHPDLRRVALHGSGGRVGRVRRFLEANASRPVLVERWSLARDLGLRVCPDGLYLRAGAVCQTPRPADPNVARLLARQLASVDRGSPSAAGAIADVSCRLGSSLWHLGQAGAAYDVLLAGVAPAQRPARLADRSLLDQAPPLRTGVHAWRRAAARGDPARNLFLAAAIVEASGQAEAAGAYLDAAAAAGLPEARAVLARRRQLAGPR